MTQPNDALGNGRWLLSEEGSRLVDEIAEGLARDPGLARAWADFDRDFVECCLYVGSSGPAYDGEAAQTFLVAEHAASIDLGARVYTECARRGGLAQADAEALGKLARVYQAGRQHLERHAPGTLPAREAGKPPRPRVPKRATPPIVELEERAPLVDFVVRTATEADVEALHWLLAGLYEERLRGAYQHGEAPGVAAVAELVRELLADPRARLLVAENVAEDGGDLVGVLDYRPHPHPQRVGGRLGLSVRSGWRSRGIGSELLDALCAWADEREVERLEFGVFANNPAALRLLERKGFAVEARRRGAVRVAGEHVDLVELVRVLPGA